MSKQNDVGKILVDVRDLCAQKSAQAILSANRDMSLNLSDEQMRSLSSLIKSELVKTFDNCIDAVIKEMARPEK